MQIGIRIQPYKFRLTLISPLQTVQNRVLSADVDIDLHIHLSESARNAIRDFATELDFSLDDAIDLASAQDCSLVDPQRLSSMLWDELYAGRRSPLPVKTIRSLRRELYLQLDEGLDMQMAHQLRDGVASA